MFAILIYKGDLTMAEGSQNIMEKAEARFMEKQKKTVERNKATAENCGWPRKRPTVLRKP